MTEGVERSIKLVDNPELVLVHGDFCRSFPPCDLAV